MINVNHVVVYIPKGMSPSWVNSTPSSWFHVCPPELLEMAWGDSLLSWSNHGIWTVQLRPSFGVSGGRSRGTTGTLGLGGFTPGHQSETMMILKDSTAYHTTSHNTTSCKCQHCSIKSQHSQHGFWTTACLLVATCWWEFAQNSVEESAMGLQEVRGLHEAWSDWKWNNIIITILMINNLTNLKPYLQQ